MGAGGHAAIEAALARGDIAAAAALAERALANGRADPMILNLAAWAREEAGDYAAALALLERALALAPGDPHVRIGQGAVLRKQGRYDEALALLDRVTGDAPGLVAAWLERGYALEGLGRSRAAGESHGRAARIDPRCAPALAGLAAAAAREGDAAAARARAGEALAIDPGNVAAHCALAAADLATGDPARAAVALDRLLARRDLAPLDRIQAATLRGDALDRMDAVHEAFAAYAAANDAYAALYAPHRAGRPDHSAFVAHLDAALNAADPARWSPLDAGHEPAGFAAHAFLLGYPRSGTTLVETMLAGIPGVAALEERPTLAEADHAFLLPEDGMARLGALDVAGAAPLRAAYWARARREGASGSGTLLDMDPLKSLRLPLIARLFPQARVLIMQRDPRDVVWSCFRHNFRFSAANYEYVSVERAARHYDAVMRFVDRCLVVLPIAHQRIDYAAVVSRFEATTQDMCRFLDLAWSPGLHDFGETARRRDITTASAAQVRRGLFDGGGQWRRYARQLAPAIPILAPWIERFGTAG